MYSSAHIVLVSRTVSTACIMAKMNKPSSMRNPLLFMTILTLKQVSLPAISVVTILFAQLSIAETGSFMSPQGPIAAGVTLPTVGALCFAQLRASVMRTVVPRLAGVGGQRGRALTLKIIIRQHLPLTHPLCQIPACHPQSAV